MARARAWVALILFLTAVDMGVGRTPRLGSSREKEYLNPDIAIGNQFHVAAKQWDGTMRCYFIDVGNRIEQGPTNIRSNEQCTQSYRKEIALGRYDGTLAPDSSPVRVFMQQYVNGDSAHCGTDVGRRDRKGLVDPSNGPKARQVRRQTTLVMLRNEGQVDITAHVKEPRKCKYEVTLEGPQQLLLGSAPGGGVASVEPVAEASRGSQTRRQQKPNARPNVPANPKTAPASETRRNQKSKTDSKRSKYSEGKYQEAVKVVEQSSREDLASRPAKELKKLLRNLDADCKGCYEKAHFVDRLIEAVRDKDEL